jgi:hypothetical protein
MNSHFLLNAVFVEKISIGPFEAKRQVSYELTLLPKCSMDNRYSIAEEGVQHGQ